MGLEFKRDTLGGMRAIEKMSHGKKVVVVRVAADEMSGSMWID